MSARERAKGARIERELVHLHEEVGVHAERFPLSGAMRYQGKSHDIAVYPFGMDEIIYAEIKGRKNGAGFTMLDNWLGKKVQLFLKKDRGKPGVYMPWETYVRYLEEIQRCHRALKNLRLDETLGKLALADGENNGPTTDGAGAGIKKSGTRKTPAQAALIEEKRK